ncbi:hypothetical protein LTR91_023859 [Friedmanniomyces endolithicus]|uniref:Uncharacterized protein n=1 Tax=Friedmanniomyces endolithicus TaxID=329885 RepID=A0AAN6H2W8_9PEZI|nr:hypothetical protein LTR91_023859 [Friedmanniomyces endolithicus]
MTQDELNKWIDNVHDDSNVLRHGSDTGNRLVFWKDTWMDTLLVSPDLKNAFHEEVLNVAISDFERYGTWVSQDPRGDKWLVKRQLGEIFVYAWE